MRRSILVLAIALILSAGLSAQVLNIPVSILGEVTNGIFLNELDAAANVNEGRPGPDFSTLGKLYMFGALDNLNQYLADSSAAVLPWVGVYLPGSMPLALFDRLSFTNAGVETASDAIINTSTKTVTVSGVDHDYIWTNRNRAYDYRTRAFANMDNTVRANMALGAMNLGLGFRANITDATVAADNYTLADTRYFDSAAAGVAPNPQVNTTVTSTLADLHVSQVYDLEGGLFMKTGDLWHNFVLGAGFGGADLSFTDNVVQTAPPVDPASGAGGYTNTYDERSRSTGLFTLGLLYSASTPVSGGGADARSYFGLDVDMSANSAKYASDDHTAAFTYVAGGGAAAVAAAVSSDVTTLTSSPRIDLSAMAFAGRYIYFQPAPAVQLGFRPNLSLSYGIGSNGLAVITGGTRVVRADNDANGVYTDAADTTTTTTSTYDGYVLTDVTTGAIAATATTNTLSLSAALPVGAVVSIPKMPFQFLMGATPSLGWGVTKTDAAVATISTATTVRDGTGATVGTDTVTYTTTAPSTDVATTWSPAITYSFGLHADLGDNVDLDLQLNSNTLIDFDDLSFQLIFSLDAPASSSGE